QRTGGVDISEARVRDGDTYYMGRLGYRLARVDTPEIGERAECEREVALGLAARDRVAELFVEARRVEAFPDRANSGQASIDEDGWPLDRYSRRLATVSVDGRDLGQLLLEENMAVRWPGRSNWCE
ncbi:MAG TPA: hypothetical protein PKY87_14620, partial [Terricaulis sp.]|nr:hypothetical protein [Terricaulis sp.]